MKHYNATKNETDLLFYRIALNDDKEAFEILFTKFFASLCVYALRFINDKETCEDIVQEVFFKLWKNRKTLEIINSTRNFLVTNVKNSCIDHLRHKEVEDTYLFKLTSKTTEEEQEEIYAAVELEEALNKALSKLPENTRKAFEMSRFQGMSYPEIALKNQISIKTVEAHMSRALKVLRMELQDYLLLIPQSAFFLLPFLQ